MDISDAFEALMFYIFAAVALISAIGCVVSSNIVRTAMWLLGTLGGVAGLYFLLFANLLAAIQLIVYAGGILVLIIFGVMLTSKSPWQTFQPRRWEVVLAAVLSVLIFIGLSATMLSVDWSEGAATIDANATVAAIGKTLLTAYLVPFEVASVLLLVVMIGAAYLARAEKRT